VITKEEKKTFCVGALNLLARHTLHAATKTVDCSSGANNLNHPQQLTISLVLGQTSDH